MSEFEIVFTSFDLFLKILTLIISKERQFKTREPSLDVRDRYDGEIQISLLSLLSQLPRNYLMQRVTSKENNRILNRVLFSVTI